jgi:hypothetical protein
VAFFVGPKNTNKFDNSHTTNLEKTMTKEEALTMIREVAEKLGHTPSFAQLEQMTPLPAARHPKAFWQLYLGAAGSRVGIQI